MSKKIKNAQSAKRSFFLSVLTLILCLTMLLGTTYAWFTDEVSTGSNKIIAGNLDVDLIMWNGSEYESIADKDAAIFGNDNSLIAQNDSTNTLWEPGKTQIVFLGVQNKGNLALKYNIVVKVVDGGLVGSLEYAFIDGVEATSAPAVTNWTELKAAAGDNNVADLPAGSIKAAENGVLDEIAYDATKVNETDYFALAIHMKESAGNEYKNMDVTIDVNVVATQVEAEEDSFGKDYDANVSFPVEFAEADPSNVEEVLAALEPGSTVILKAASYGDLEIPAEIDNITILADDGAKLDKISIPKDAQIKDLTIENVHFDLVENAPLISSKGATLDNITFKDCEILANSGNKYSQKIMDLPANDTGSITFEGCTFENVGRGIHTANGTSIEKLTLKDCNIKNCSSWLCQGNAGSLPGIREITIDGCTFENVDGLVKYGPVVDKFTFTNNTVVANENSDPAVYHYGHDNSAAKTFDITVKELVVSGNKIGTEDWTPNLANGLKSAS